MGEDCASNDQIIEGTEVGEKLPVLVLFTLAMFAHDHFSLDFVFSHFGVHVSRDDLQVFLWCSVHGCLELVVKLLLVICVRGVCWSIALDDGDLSTLGVVSGHQDPW